MPLRPRAGRADPGLVVAQPVLVISLTLGLMAAKFLAMWAVGVVFRQGRRDASTVAVSLAQGGEFAFVLFQFAVTEGALDADSAFRLGALDELFEHMSRTVSQATQRVVGRALTGEDHERLIREALQEFASKKA